MVLATALAVWVVKIHLFPSAFKPVTLDAQDVQTLSAKPKRLEVFDSPKRSAGARPSAGARAGAKPLEPDAYSEVRAKREISFTERELNAMIGKNTDLAEKLAFDLSDDPVSMKLLVPLDEDFPMFGGQTLRVKAGVEMITVGERPAVVLKGISAMGVPLPNAWLGDGSGNLSAPRCTALHDLVSLPLASRRLMAHWGLCRFASRCW